MTLQRILGRWRRPPAPGSHRRRVHGLAVITLGALAAGSSLGACSGGDSVGEAGAGGTSGTIVGGGTAGAEGTGADGPGTTATEPVTASDPTTPATGSGSTDGTTDVTTGALPGTPFDIGPRAGTPMVVVGVRYDDVLNLRTRPDPGSVVVATVAPLAASPAIVSDGEGRLLDRSAWWRVTVGGRQAWANVAFLGSLGTPVDALGDLSATLPSIEAANLEALAAAIAAMESGGPEPAVTMASKPTATSATVDVLGLGDDALKGVRYALTVEPTGSGGVKLVAAQRTPICGRGLSAGSCL